MAEFPHLMDIYDKYSKEDIEILSINTINRAGKVKSDAQRFDLPFTVLIGRDSDVGKNYKITRLPLLIIVDKSGKIVLKKKFAAYVEISKKLDVLLDT